MVNGAVKLYRVCVCVCVCVLTPTGFLSRRKALTFPDKGLLLLVEDYPIRQLVLCEKDFGWMAL
jgi:hypothetical protein